MGRILSDRDAARTEACVRAFEQNANQIPRNRRRSGGEFRPNIRAILLEELDADDVADAAVTELVETTQIQRIYVEGMARSGTFTLTFQSKTTDPLEWDATAEDVQSALEELESIGKGNVEVTLGKTTESTPGVWLVTFLGKLGGQEDLPLMTGTSSIVGAAVVLTQATHWLDSGRIEQVRAAIPVGVPTPMRAGAVVLAIPIPGAGYCVAAVESRDFDPYGPPYGI